MYRSSCAGNRESLLLSAIGQIRVLLLCTAVQQYWSNRTYSSVSVTGTAVAVQSMEVQQYCCTAVLYAVLRMSFRPFPGTAVRLLVPFFLSGMEISLPLGINW